MSCSRVYVMFKVWQRFEQMSSIGRHYAECHSVATERLEITHTIFHPCDVLIVHTTTAPFVTTFTVVLERVELFVHALSMAANGGKVKR